MTAPLRSGGQTLRVIRAQLILRDGPYCGRCSTWIDTTLTGLQPDGPTIGHVIPVAEGGTDSIDNLRLEHRRCNLAAGKRADPPRAVIATPIEVS